MVDVVHTVRGSADWRVAVYIDGVTQKRSAPVRLNLKGVSNCVL